MRVLHGTYEIAGQGMVLAGGLRAHGVDADSLAYRVDWDGRVPRIVVELDRLDPVSRVLAMNRTLKRYEDAYDVFHFHFGSSFFGAGAPYGGSGWLARFLARRDVPGLKKRGKTVVFHFHGCEVRNRAHMLATHARSTCTECRPFCAPDRQRALLADASRYADRVFFSTKDLAESVPHGIELPLAIETARWEEAARSYPPVEPGTRDGVRGPVVLAHAPTNRFIKGTSHVEDAFERLRTEFPRLELKLIEKLPWAEMPRALASCDLLVDQLFMGWYGLLAIEGMSLGKAVVCHLRADFTEADCPVVDVTDPEARWAAEVLLSLTGLAWSSEPGEGPVVRVGSAGGDVLLPWSGLAPAWTPSQLALATFEGVPVPCPGGRLSEPSSANALPGELLRAAFSLLSREEERLIVERDQWQCFAGTQSRLYALGVLERPLVNEWALLLAERLKAFPVEKAPLWPNGARHAAMLSHDVDEVRYGSVREGLRLLAFAPRSYALRAGLTQVARGLATRGTDPYWNFERWLDSETKRGFGSSFFFCAERPAVRHEYDARYRFRDPVGFEHARGTVTDLMQLLVDRGRDVGLHGSYLSHVSAVDLRAQKSQIECDALVTAYGTRQHFLRFDVERTFAAQEEAGFDYDSTLGYNEALGFRAGIAAPFHPWNAAKREPHRLLELPLTVMDGTLFRTLGMTGEAAGERVRKHLDAVEAVGGLAVLLWHPNSAAETHYPGWWTAWEAALDHLAARGAWVTSGRKIAEHWRRGG